MTSEYQTTSSKHSVKAKVIETNTAANISLPLHSLQGTVTYLTSFNRCNKQKRGLNPGALTPKPLWFTSYKSTLCGRL